MVVRPEEWRTSDRLSGGTQRGLRPLVAPRWWRPRSALAHPSRHNAINRYDCSPLSTGPTTWRFFFHHIGIAIDAEPSTMSTTAGGSGVTMSGPPRVPLSRVEAAVADVQQVDISVSEFICVSLFDNCLVITVTCLVVGS